MGLIKAGIILTIAVVISKFIESQKKKYEKKPYYKYIAPYVANQCSIILTIIMMILILL